MKVFVYKSSGMMEDGEVMEFADMKECVDTLLMSDAFVRFAPQIIICKPDSLMPEKGKDCEYEIELYNSWRE